MTAIKQVKAFIVETDDPDETVPDCKSAHEAVSKEQAVLLWYEGFRSEPIPVLEAWEAIGHDIGCNPSKQELLDSLRNMAAICEAHGNDMPKPAQPAQQAEEVEVVAYMEENGHLWNDTTHPGRMTQLMTVDQHNRILAARVPAGCKVVPVELLERLEHVTRTLVPHLQCHVDLRALLASVEGGE